MARIHAISRHGVHTQSQGGSLMNVLRHICGARAGLALRSAPKKVRDKYFSFLYALGDENNKIYQRAIGRG